MVLIPGCPLITHEKTKKIIQQMEKSICQIKNENCYGTGFFCKIPFPDKDNFLPVLITAYHILHEEALNQIDKKIHITFENEQVFELDLNKRIKYTNKKYDITIIEIKENDNIDMNSFLEIDDQIFKDNPNDLFKRSSTDLLILNPRCVLRFILLPFFTIIIPLL